MNSSVTSNTVTVVLPRLKNAESEFCFTAIGKTEAFSIAVEGTFKTGISSILDSTLKL